MKKWLFWSFSRGSFQYDVLCALILIAIFLIPRTVFNDRPDYMRVPESGIGRSGDGDGNDVYTVKLEESLATPAAEQWALGQLEAFLTGEAGSMVFRSEPVYNTRGHLVAFAFWLR
jgi:hypothetical protein